MNDKILLNLILSNAVFACLLLFLTLLKTKPHKGSIIFFIAKASLLVNACLTLTIFGRLAKYFITDDFSLAYVASNSSQGLPLLYKISAIWSGGKGSLLLWMCFTTAFAFYAVVFINPKLGSIGTISGLFLSLITAIFSFILSQVTPLFAISSPVPRDGRGLSLALQSPYIFFHPPLIFFSYTALSLAFTLAVGLYWPRKKYHETFLASHLACVRTWGLIAWLGLTFSIFLGSLWAYQKINGNYWEWNPLENMALTTWLLLASWVHLLTLDRKIGRQSLQSCVFLGLAYIIPLSATCLIRTNRLDFLNIFFGIGAIAVGYAAGKLAFSQQAMDKLLISAVTILSCAAMLILGGSSLLLSRTIFTLGLTPLGFGMILLLGVGFFSSKLKTRSIHLGIILMLSGFWLEALIQQTPPAWTAVTRLTSFKAKFLTSPLLLLTGAGMLCVLGGITGSLFKIKLGVDK